MDGVVSNANEVTEFRLVLDHPCPLCGAVPGNYCYFSSGLLRRHHRARVKAARNARPS